MRKNCILALAPILFFILIWQFFVPTSTFLPSPSMIGQRLFENYDRFLYHSSATLLEMLGGFLFAIIIAFPLGWGMSEKRILKSMMQPFFILMKCLPMFSLAPLMILWFGWSYTARVIPTTLMIVFPLTITILKGMSSTPKPLVEYFTLNGASPLQIFIKLKIPSALPLIFAGLRISAVTAGVGAIAGELSGAQKGLGVLLNEHRRNIDMEGLFGALICLLILTFSFYGFIIILEKIFLRKNYEMA
ncbi:MAG: ABC transporter permease [Simkaniaceae bacterium]|nr:ABC transporter permease [Simkaniaceae bacterium]